MAMQKKICSENIQHMCVFVSQINQKYQYRIRCSKYGANDGKYGTVYWQDKLFLINSIMHILHMKHGTVQVIITDRFHYHNLQDYINI